MAERRRPSFAEAQDQARRDLDAALTPNIPAPSEKPSSRPRPGASVLPGEPRLHVVPSAQPATEKPDDAVAKVVDQPKPAKTPGKRSRRQFVEVQEPQPGSARTQRSMAFPSDLVQQMAHHCLGHAASAGRTVEHSWIVDSAMRSLPNDVGAVIALAKQFGATWRGERLIRNTYVVSPQALEVVDRWRDKVIAAGHSPREVPVNDVYIAALSTWLTHAHQALPTEDHQQ